MNNLNYQETSFITSVSDICNLPNDAGIEVAFIGRSNAGKSSVLNTLTNKKNLAHISKKPGCTKFINLFEITEGKRLVELPGYGYAKVPNKIKQKWQYLIGEYLEERLCLKGLVILMDIRHPLKSLDQEVVRWAVKSNIPSLVLLSKSDKVSSLTRKLQLNTVRKAVITVNSNIQAETFSSFRKQGVYKLRRKLDEWYRNFSLKEK